MLIDFIVSLLDREYRHRARANRAARKAWRADRRTRRLMKQFAGR